MTCRIDILVYCLPEAQPFNNYLLEFSCSPPNYSPCFPLPLSESLCANSYFKNWLVKLDRLFSRTLENEERIQFHMILLPTNAAAAATHSLAPANSNSDARHLSPSPPPLTVSPSVHSLI